MKDFGNWLDELTKHLQRIEIKQSPHLPTPREDEDEDEDEDELQLLSLSGVNPTVLSFDEFDDGLSLWDFDDDDDTIPF